jgi:diaminopimelate decarboxylase
VSARPLPFHLLPDSAVVDDGGELMVGGCRLTDLAAEFGTPLFVYDEDHIRARCREAITAFGADNVVYATKAFLCVAMARLVHEEGLMLDVASGGELHVALSAGVPADRCVLHGNNKSVAELRMAIEAGVHHLVVDSFDELDRLDALFVETGQAPRIQLRLTPGVHAHTHEFISTGQDDSKFGFTVSTGSAAKAIERSLASPSVELIGLHCHIGSNVFRAESFGEAMRVMAEIANPLGLPHLTIGGGLGVGYVEGEHAPTIAAWGGAVRTAAENAHVTSPVSVEPGRSLVASAAVTLYTVGTMKDLPEIRRYISVDGGMSDNPRPVLYGSGYEGFLPRSPLAERPLEARLVGKHCESGDVLIFDANLPADTRVGDILATPVTGAYGHSMASNYNKLTRPAVVFVRDGKSRLVVRRESYDDLIRNDIF